MIAILLLAVNLTLTPGVVRTDLNGAQICSIKWGLDHRHVTLAMKREVFRRYGIPWSEHAKFEVDHLYPRELGGDDKIPNLWPQLYAGEWNAHMKDRLENFLHRQVCSSSGSMTLETARSMLVPDWRQAYARFLK